MLDRRCCCVSLRLLGLAVIVAFTACTLESSLTPLERERAESGEADQAAPRTPVGPAPLFPPEFQNIRPQELAAMLEEKNFLLINTSPPIHGRIESTDKHLPFQDSRDWIEQFPAAKNARIVLYCRAGISSVSAARKLSREGYTRLYNLQGGIRAWEAAGFPVVRFSGR